MQLKLRRAAALLCILCCGACASAAEPASNAALRKLFQEDQAAREQKPATIDWKQVTADDSERREAVHQMLARGEVRSAEDFYHAAVVFQHGQDTDDIRLAFALSTIAVKLAPDMMPARWMTAASWDRILMRMEQPQWYGTQFSKSRAPGAKWELYKMNETAVTDAQRKAHDVPTLQESQERVKEMNAPK